MSSNTTEMGSHYDPVMDNVLAVVYYWMFVCVISLNGLEIFLIWRLRHDPSVTTVFVFSLTLTDIIMGSLGIPFSAISITNQRQWIFGDVMCNITGFFVNTCIFTSLLSICVITLNRYLALLKPLQYKQFVTFRTAVVTVVIIWFLGFLRSSVPFFYGYLYKYHQNTLCNWSTYEVFGANELPYFIIILVLPFCLTFCAIIFCSTHMCITLIKRKTDKKALTRRNKTDKEKEAVITTFCIIAAFIFSYFIYYFSLFVYLINKFQNWSNTLFLYVEVLMILTIYMNSFFNPILYIIRNTRYKQELRRIKHRLLGIVRCIPYPGGGSSTSQHRKDRTGESSTANRTEYTRATTAHSAMIVGT